MSIWADPNVSKFAEWVMSAVVGKLVSAGYSYLRKRILPYNSEVELKRLKTALPRITAVMSVAEALKVKYPSTSKWVEQFRLAIEASEKVLIELEYKNDDEADESASSSKKRKRCTISDGTLKMLKDAVTLMDLATTDIDRLLQLATALGVQGVSESRQDTNKILRQGINLCLAERKVLGYRNPYLRVSYLEIDLFYLPSSLGSSRRLSLVSCVSLTSISFMEIYSRKWLNPLEEIENLEVIGLIPKNFTRSLAASVESLSNRLNVSISIADFFKVLQELLTSLEKNDIRGHGMQIRPSQISVDPALSLLVLEAFQRLTLSHVPHAMSGL